MLVGVGLEGHEPPGFDDGALGLVGVGVGPVTGMVEEEELVGAGEVDGGEVLGVVGRQPGMGVDRVGGGLGPADVGEGPPPLRVAGDPAELVGGGQVGDAVEPEPRLLAGVVAGQGPVGAHVGGRQGPVGGTISRQHVVHERAEVRVPVLDHAGEGGRIAAAGREHQVDRHLTWT